VTVERERMDRHRATDAANGKERTDTGVAVRRGHFGRNRGSRLPLDDVGCVFDDRRVECTMGAVQANY
jgi:hypothetical protein